MKIKDGIVISKSDLEKWKIAHEEFIATAGLFQKALYETSLATINKVIEESKLLEPIIRDAYCDGFGDGVSYQEKYLEDYIDETDI